MGKRQALVVGISEYGEGFESLPGSVRDVQALTPLLDSEECGAFETRSLENCDRFELETAIETFFRGKSPEDVLLFYFSGHGDLGSGGMLNQQLHFCTRNSTKQENRLVESSAVPASFLARQMGLSKSKKIIVILDCCYSGAIGDLLKKGEEEIDYGELKATGRVILAASSATKVALQAKDGLSLYTRYLIEGMKGSAYGGQNGQGDWIVARSLHDYADRRFEIENKGYPPKIFADETGYNLPVAKAPKADPKLEYRKIVDRTFQELDQRYGLDFNGEIADKPLVLQRLQIAQRKQNISPDLAAQILHEVQSPYQTRGLKFEEYKKAFRLATENGTLPDEYDRQLLLEICHDLGIGQEEADRIEQKLIEELSLSSSVSTHPIFHDRSPTIVTPNQPLILTLKPKKGGKTVPLDLLPIPGGSFSMGQTEAETKQLKKEAGEDTYKQSFARELPRHRVTVPPFWMGRFPVTQAQYEAVMGENPATRYDKKFVSPNQPVIGVSWDMAVKFCEALNGLFEDYQFRLPTEAEWEYACRGGTETAFYFGDKITPDQANFDGNFTYNGSRKGKYRQVTTPVGQFPANAWGLQDMHGNVWEWCADEWYDSYAKKPEQLKQDGSIPWTKDSSGISPSIDGARLLRGGSWCGYPGSCRSARRSWSNLTGTNDFIGVRVVCFVRTS
jgi:formylglycine-generating enzyme required for sulfatase activity